jgi:hypothetical protein
MSEVAVVDLSSSNDASALSRPQSKRRRSDSSDDKPDDAEHPRSLPDVVAWGFQFIKHTGPGDRHGCAFFGDLAFLRNTNIERDVSALVRPIIYEFIYATYDNIEEEFLGFQITIIQTYRDGAICRTTVEGSFIGALSGQSRKAQRRTALAVFNDVSNHLQANEDEVQRQRMRHQIVYADSDSDDAETQEPSPTINDTTPKFK